MVDTSTVTLDSLESVCGNATEKGDKTGCSNLYKENVVVNEDKDASISGNDGKPVKVTTDESAMDLSNVMETGVEEEECVENGDGVKNVPAEIGEKNNAEVQVSTDSTLGDKQNVNKVENTKVEVSNMQKTGYSYANATSQNLLDKNLISIPTDALTSRVGKPLIMDAITTLMCKLGVGRIGFARVLVEVTAKKDLPKVTEVVYRNGQNLEICRKVVEVLYDWKPPMCKQCCVFGHDDTKCGNKEVNSSVEKESLDKDKGKEPELVEKSKADDGFKEVRYKNNKANGVNGDNGARKQNVQNVQKGKFHKPTTRFEYQPKAKTPNGSKNDVQLKNRATNEQRKDNGEASTSQSFKSPKKTWTVNNVRLEAIQRTSNKFAGLEMENVNDVSGKSAVGNNGKGNNNDTEKEEGIIEEEDVLSDDSGIGKSMNENEVKGMDKGVLGDC
ncbi:ATPase, F1/V1/A1 complex, alpha/beta subunit, Zinc knuckle CX2CX4HX4C [Artemisia annua]|uniref:ATPase, F1/V1/A1 complex, alpha/beta subunit, Zinc knuckle CX2CX4HX4C n=1 Tax=Artemisia annua TaxID=35608 RepID=A0A2U1PIF6_ARTAN|nr:ATPase, F1/V1/A1 complex, alpha/beta subunit, Zinc knuckle CX2CX4HX4C [Artemisia annua]